MKDGEPVVEPVPVGEIVWTDDLGVTCRRWNWRQGNRTRIDLQTRRAWFEFDRLEPMPVDAAADAAVALTERLRQISRALQFTVHRIDRAGTIDIS
jgi:DNA/RNA-binding domain of Phe-tRNA-synthetase-like protein